MTNTFPKFVYITLYDVQPSPDKDGTFVTVKPLKGTDYKASPYTLEDIDAVDRWLRQKALDGFTQTAKSIEGLDRKDFLEVVATETRRVSRIGWGSKEAVEFLVTAEGLSFLIWQVIHKGTDLSFDNLRKMVQAKENQISMLEAIRRLNSLDSWGVSHPIQA